jgi:hypothetical protein
MRLRGVFRVWGNAESSSISLIYLGCLISFYLVGSMAPDKGLRTGRAGSLQTTVRLLVVPDLLVSSTYRC